VERKDVCSISIIRLIKWHIYRRPLSLLRAMEKGWGWEKILYELPYTLITVSLNTSA